MKKFLTAFVTLMMSIACLALAACAPMNIEKAEDKMKDAGYTVVSYDEIEADGLVGGIIATKIEGLLDGDILYALYFSSIGDAKDYYDGLDKKDDVKWEGKWVFSGTDDAMEDFTKLF